ncbi:LysR family transcriptional regulator [Aquicoccus sp. G2-2]|uniref:LysR family transcriptional regulator n=1 Tax=Aquicoccus sp. G2-2 TaxID=3092120 RepID=UPI002AE06AD7|nr:LysR family transcriptional regulator [Aquicoccus sp. G2-2]MEA1115167.1 LysR family transcriptional regulator [Aquicoccus sp. G2-2]
MDNWDEVRTAYHVALAGTVSGAAEALGVHHATVIRHVDALEARLGVNLFQRHARGYTPTEAGEDLLRVARATDEQLSQLSSRIKGWGEAVEGEVVVTALAEIAAMLAPVLTAFQAEYPGLIVRLLASARLFRLEYGEAHVAVRAGSQAPDEPDNVVQKLGTYGVGLYASPGYIKAHGMPENDAALAAHRFVAGDDTHSRAPYAIWLRQHVPETAITFRADDFHACAAAVRAGAGLGFLRPERAQSAELVQVMAPRAEWAVRLWLVTHMDLHRTAKVQTLGRFLKAQMQGMN